MHRWEHHRRICTLCSRLRSAWNCNSVSDDKSRSKMGLQCSDLSITFSSYVYTSSIDVVRSGHISCCPKFWVQTVEIYFRYFAVSWPKCIMLHFILYARGWSNQKRGLGAVFSFARPDSGRRLHVEPCIEGIESRYFDLAKLTLGLSLLCTEELWIMMWELFLLQIILVCTQTVAWV